MPAAAPDRRRAPRGRRPALRALWSGALVLALAVGVPALERTGLVDGAGVAAAGPRRFPTPGHESTGSPLGHPEPVAVPSASWSAGARGTDGEPARWDPCRPVHYVVNPEGAPPGGEAVLAAALERVSRATGLRFVRDGTTDETDRAQPYDPQRWGDRWAPALLRWNVPVEAAEDATQGHGESRRSAGEQGTGGVVLGRGGPVLARTSSGRAVIVSGSAGVTASALGDFGDPAVRRRVQAVWLHELAHMVGLGHVEDPAQLMNPEFTGVAGFAAGDLTGLAALGGGPCLGEV
ncbi:peptidase [Kineococcus arenarius]|uniref:peptidase n=1 Tax=unclassified Kineococcus TaxID=2621656 RepID=UPI003D7DAC79